MSLLSRLIIVYLVYTELRYYWHETDIIYQFQPDMALDEQVQMHVDITVAMPCASLSGVDLMDETQQDVFAYGTLQREGVWWKMSDTDRRRFQSMQLTNHYLREEYHSVADILFKDILRDRQETHAQHTAEQQVKDKDKQDNNHPPAAAANSVADAVAQVAQDPQKYHKMMQPETKYDACRLHGTLGINKVAGVLHLVGGAEPVVGLFEDHWMIEFRRMPANFTHRINRLSFGQYSRRIVQPLEGDERIINEEATTVQYFIKVVPTEIQHTFSTISTFQYAVTENVRKLGKYTNTLLERISLALDLALALALSLMSLLSFTDSERNSYGSPGIYFKYDWSALKIVVSHDRDYLPTFCIRLCSIISGIIVISGAVNAFLVSLQRRLLQTFAPQLYQRHHYATANTSGSASGSGSMSAPTISVGPTTLLQPSAGVPVNELLNTANLMANVDISAYLPTAPSKSDRKNTS